MIYQTLWEQIVVSSCLWILFQQVTNYDLTVNLGLLKSTTSIIFESKFTHETLTIFRRQRNYAQTELFCQLKTFEPNIMCVHHYCWWLNCSSCYLYINKSLVKGSRLRLSHVFELYDRIFEPHANTSPARNLTNRPSMSLSIQFISPEQDCSEQRYWKMYRFTIRPLMGASKARSLLISFKSIPNDIFFTL